MSLLEPILRDTLSREKVENEIDLVDIISKKITEANLPFSQNWHQEEEIVEAVGKNSDMQRFLISRNLVFKLQATNEPHVLPRLCLNNNGSMSEYLELFDEHVIPALKSIDGN